MRWCWLIPLLATLACEDEAVPEGECPVAVWAQPQRPTESLTVRGSWDDWDEERAMRRFDDRWRVATFSLPPGEYGYQIVEAREGRLDATHGLTRFRAGDGLEVSYVNVSACDAPRIQRADAQPQGPDGLTIQLEVAPARTQAGLATVRVLGHESRTVSTDDGISVVVEGLPPGKHALPVEIVDEEGVRSVQEVDAWVQPRAQRPEDQIIYQIMIDRFVGEDGVALEPPPNPGARAGGTLTGITAALREGTFDALPITTLWLSPAYLNPDEARGGTDGRRYEGYHGYWPVDSRGVDPRIGGEAALHELVDEAHARGIRVLLDIVPNHVYETNPRYAEYLEQGAVHQREPLCICGQPDCPWDRFIQTCWFVPYLPDLDFRAPGVLSLAVEDALWWQETFDLDGFRVDAVPMMPRAVTRRIAAGVRRQVLDPRATFSLGEIFTGPGSSGTEVLRYHLGPDALDSAFDFPLMWSLRSAIAHDGPGFDAVEAGLQHTEQAIAGSGATLGLMIGNHDVTRFVSEVVGDAGLDPWGDDVPEQPAAHLAYDKQAMALGLVFTLPGAPVLYYGDEVGLAGGRDPDSRRVMPSEDALLPAQRALRTTVRRLAAARRCSTALRRGDRVTLHASSHTWAFMRDAGDSGPVVVIAHRGDEEDTVTLGQRVYAGAYRDVVTGDELVISSDAAISLPPWSLRVLVPAAHPCAD